MPLRSLVGNARRVLPNVRCMSAKGPLTDLKVDDKGVATLTLQRLPVNSLNVDLLQDIEKALDEVEKNKSRGLILTSASPTVFSAGLDIMEMYKPDPQRLDTFWRTLQSVWLKLYGSKYPTAAAINGHAPAGGCLLAMSCEYRAMVSGKFGIGLNETALGIVAPSWFIASMVNTIPVREAELALTTGRMFSVDEALKVGLIDVTASDKEDAIAKARQFIQKFDKIPPLARSMTKLSCRGAALQGLAKNREADLEEFKRFALSPQVQKGLELYMASLKQKAAK